MPTAPAFVCDKPLGLKTLLSIARDNGPAVEWGQEDTDLYYFELYTEVDNKTLAKCLMDSHEAVPLVLDEEAQKAVANDFEPDVWAEGGGIMGVRVWVKVPPKSAQEQAEGLGEYTRTYIVTLKAAISLAGDPSCPIPEDDPEKMWRVLAENFLHLIENGMSSDPEEVARLLTECECVEDDGQGTSRPVYGPAEFDGRPRETEGQTT